METSRTQQLDTIHRFATPEHISFEFRIAGPMVRALAWLIDILVMVLIVICVYAFLSFIISSPGLLSGVFSVFSFFVLWLYDLLLEWLWQGFTPGKKALGIRVIGVDGLPISFRSSFLRNTIRYVDWLPFGYSLGMVTMFFNGRFQRLGDLAAGTLVVYVEDSKNIKPLIIKNKQVEQALHDLPASALSLLDAEATQAIASYASSRLHYHPDRRNEIAAHLADPIAQTLGIKNVKPDILLSALYMKLFHNDDENAMGAKAAKFLSKRRPIWKKLEKILVSKRNQQPKQAEALSQHYRAACADLALANAYQLPPQNISYLHGLVSRSHLRFYQRLHFKWSNLFKLVFETVPGRLYNDSCLRIAGLAFFGVFFACALIGAFDSSIAESYLGVAELENMQDMYADAPNDRDGDTAAAMGGFYIANNVGISFTCFAYGIFAGIGSLILLIFNGIFIGLIFGFMASNEVDPSIRAHFFEFVTAHGPFELCGIMLSGAAGLRLGLGMIITRGLPRLESLQNSARESVSLMCVAATSVALAAPIEAFISPSSVSINGKIAVCLLSCIIIIGYLALGARYKERNILDRQEAQQ